MDISPGFYKGPMKCPYAPNDNTLKRFTPIIQNDEATCYSIKNGDVESCPDVIGSTTLTNNQYAIHMDQLYPRENCLYKQTPS